MRGKLTIMRAYYGLKSHIKQYVDLLLASTDANQPDTGNLYWEDEAGAADEDFGSLHIVNVTTAIRFQLDTKEKCLFLRSGSKQFLLGVYNPIPNFRRDSHTPSLCLIYRLQDPDSEERTVHHEYFEDD